MNDMTIKAFNLYNELLGSKFSFIDKKEDNKEYFELFKEQNFIKELDEFCENANVDIFMKESRIYIIPKPNCVFNYTDSELINELYSAKTSKDNLYVGLYIFIILLSRFYISTPIIRRDEFITIGRLIDEIDNSLNGLDISEKTEENLQFNINQVSKTWFALTVDNVNKFSENSPLTSKKGLVERFCIKYENLGFIKRIGKNDLNTQLYPTQKLTDLITSETLNKNRLDLLENSLKLKEGE